MNSYYELYSACDLETIHDTSLGILGKAGLEITHAKGQEMLADAGARIDRAKGRVYISEAMVEKCLATAQRNFICAGRTTGKELGSDPQTWNETATKSSTLVGLDAPSYMRSVAGSIHYCDMFSGEIRDLTQVDLANAARLGDALENIGCIGTLSISDVQPEMFDITGLRILLENTRKPIWALTTSSRNLRYQLEMAEVVANGKENIRAGNSQISGVICLISPLSFPDDEIERALLYAEYKLPVRVPIGGIMGGNAPYTVAGMLSQLNAEFLGSLVLLQTLCPGMPTWYYANLQTLDMISGKVQFNGPELQMMYGAITQLARRYNVPTTFPNATVSCSQPHQALMQMSQAIMFGSSIGITEQGSAGALDGGNAFSPHAMVIQNDLMNYAKRMANGFDLSDDTLAEEVIVEIATGTKEYLTSTHTMAHLRKEERFRSELINHINSEQLNEAPTTLIQRADAIVNKTLSSHEVPPLDDAVLKALSEIEAAAAEELKKGVG